MRITIWVKPKIVAEKKKISREEEGEGGVARSRTCGGGQRKECDELKSQEEEKSAPTA